jgi:hypothetical protein
VIVVDIVPSLNRYRLIAYNIHPHLTNIQSLSSLADMSVTLSSHQQSHQSD